MSRSVIYLGLIAVAALCPPGAAAQELLETVYDGVLFDRPNSWDSYPSHAIIDGVHHIWYCSRSPVTMADGIFYSTKAGGLGPSGWSMPIELMNHNDIEWSIHHVCDPSVILGDFTADSVSYTYAMYFTATLAPFTEGGHARTGVAFSNDGLDWISPYATPIIDPDNEPEGSYGSGQGDSAWGPDEGRISHIYRDSSTGTTSHGRIRYKESFDGSTFSPTPSLDSALSDVLMSPQRPASPNIAWNPVDRHWYAVLTVLPGVVGGFRELRVLRSEVRAEELGNWLIVAEISQTLTGEENHNNPGFGRNETSSLLIDKDGWAYLFFGTGEEDDVFTWKVGQARFRVMDDFVDILDGFANVGPTRQPGEPLQDTQTEVASKEWSANSSIVLADDEVTIQAPEPQDAIATVPFAPEVGAEVSQIAVTVDVAGAGWVATGFSTTAAGLFGGELWVLLNPNASIVTVYADGSNQIANVPVTIPAGENWISLEYFHGPNEVSALFNWTLVLDRFPLDSLNGGFTPVINHAGFHLREAVAGSTKLSKFVVNDDTIFADGFESGTAGAWDTCPPDCPE